MFSDIKRGTQSERVKEVVRTIFGPMGKVTESWTKLHNEECPNLHSSPSITRIAKLRKMSWAEHVARMGQRYMHVGYC
jgi:hypothetical protein